MQWPYFGWGTRRQISRICSDRKNRLLLTSPGAMVRGWCAEITALGRGGWSICTRVTPNPSLRELEAIAGEYLGQNIDEILALGGGSVLDMGKALRYSLTTADPKAVERRIQNSEESPEKRKIRLIALPTTSGTGSEVTPFATLWADRKLSFVDRAPDEVILDPELTFGLPDDVTIISALDALSHSFESAWNQNATTESLEISERAASILLEALPRIRERTFEIRGKLMIASHLSGFAISKTRTSIAHSMSYPLTLRFGVPHGLACSWTLPAILRFTEFNSFSKKLGFGSAKALSSHLESIYRKLGVGELLKKYVKDLDKVQALAPEMLDPARAKNHIVDVDPETLPGLIDQAWTGFIENS